MSEYDFTFAWEGADAPEGPWAHLRVLQFRGQEAISSLYRYEITLLAKAPAPEIDPHDLVGQRATMRIRTLSSPAYKVVHGVIAEAEEIVSTQDGMAYRVVLAPTVTRALYRRRCRIFLEKTTRQIIDAVLTGDPEMQRADALVVPEEEPTPSYRPAAERFAWRVSDPSRIDAVAARSYCVQYNESDLDFVARLLEEEGLGYHFENGAGVHLLVIADRDAGRARLEPFAPLGGAAEGREIAHVKLGARMRSKAVRLGDYNWKKPALDMLAEMRQADDFVDYSYPGGFPETPAHGAPLATARLERYSVEAEYALVSGRCRLLSAGSVFALQSGKPRHEGEYLVTRLDVRGHQEGAAVAGVAAVEDPFLMEAECARRGRDGAAAESRFRPARLTPRPRVHGSQTAFVTADPTAPGAEIQVGGPPQGEIGCVRLRFHWDREDERLAKEPSSCWVRVSQSFAGVGQGAVWHPRVGVEVIVEYEEGDPDRPIVTGRVYNGANRPPAPSVGAPTISTLKSYSSPGGGGFNEFAFDDATGNEQIRMHAQKDWNNEVGNDRSETVGNNSTSGVGVNRSESTGANRSTSVGANNMEVVGANESVSIGANQSTMVGVNQTTLVGANQSTQVAAAQALTVGAAQTVSVGASAALSVGADQSVSIGAAQSTSIGAAQTLTVGASRTVNIGATHDVTVGGSQSLTATGAQNFTSAASQTSTAPIQTFDCTLHAINAGALIAAQAGGLSSVAAPLTIANGEAVLVLTGPLTFVVGGSVNIDGGTVAVNGGSVSVTGGSVSVDGGGSIDMKAGVIKLN